MSLVTKAVLIEVASSLTTDSFLNAYRRFTVHRGPVCTLRCDRDTIFASAETGLEPTLAEMNQQRMKWKLLLYGCK